MIRPGSTRTGKPHSVNLGVQSQLVMVCGARNQRDLCYRNLFEDLADTHANFTYAPVLSDEPEGSVCQGLRGHVHEAAEQLSDGRFAGQKAKMCAPPPMADACITALMRGQLYERHMYLENFHDQSAHAGKAKSPLFKTI